MGPTAAVARILLLAVCTVAVVRAVHVGADNQHVATYSNIERRDYVGPQACARCHRKRYAQWQTSSHRSMNRLVTPTSSVMGDFSDAVVDYGGGRVLFTQSARGRFMTLENAAGIRRQYRVTRTIGWRYLQEYVGILVSGPEPEGHRAYSVEIRLPFGYWRRRRAWVHRQYFDSWHPEEYSDGELAIDPYAPDYQPWAARCAWCHNTYPHELRLRRSIPAPVGHGREQYFLFASRTEPIAGNVIPLNELVTVGISCESCHLGGREHAVNDKAIQFVPTSPRIEKRSDAPDLHGGRKNHVLINSACAQCHSTPTPRYVGGAAVRNSSEALDMARGGCATKIKCTDCHDPHERGAPSGSPDQPAHLSACVACHVGLVSEDAQLHHSGHTSDTASCLDCHMPRIVQGIDRYVRSHRISSPSRDALAQAAPNACNLCHLDRSIRWTMKQLGDRWAWDAGIPAHWTSAYQGSLDTPVGRVWLRSRPNLRLVAAHAYARSRLGSTILPELIRLLDDPVAHDRVWMLFAIEDIVSRSLSVREYDPMAPPETRARQAAKLQIGLRAVQ